MLSWTGNVNSDRTQAILIATDKLNSLPLFLDTETTGLDKISEIVEICILDSEGHVLFASLVKPTRPIPPSATDIHGITNDMVQNEPSWPQVWLEIEPILSGQEVGIYNADFDLRMIAQTNAKYGIRWRIHPDTSFFCVMRLYAQFYGMWDRSRGSYKWQSLDAAGRQCGIPLPNTHRAKDDTLLARAILHHIANSK
jgi:DNA polymerase-3 subunit epsilon